MSASIPRMTLTDGRGEGVLKEVSDVPCGPYSILVTGSVQFVVSATDIHSVGARRGIVSISAYYVKPLIMQSLNQE